MAALTHHPRIMTLNIGQSYATEDLNAQYNWLEDRAVPTVRSLIRVSETLAMFELGMLSLLSRYGPFELHLLTSGKPL